MGNKCVCVCACNLFTLLYTLLTILIHYSQTTFRNTQWYDRASIGSTIKFSTLFWAGKPRLESGITIVLLGPRGFSAFETSNKCPSHRHIECPRKRRLKRVAVGQLICIRFFFSHFFFLIRRFFIRENANVNMVMQHLENFPFTFDRFFTSFPFQWFNWKYAKCFWKLSKRNFNIAEKERYRGKLEIFLKSSHSRACWGCHQMFD